jgi:hypothetical protein
MAGQVAYHLLAGRVDTSAVARHHDRVLPAGPGPGPGDLAGPHAARRCRRRSGRTGPRDRRTSSIAVPRLARRGLGGCGLGQGRTPGPSGRVRSFRWDQDGPAAGPRRQGSSIKPGRHQPSTRGRQQACSSGKAGIQACPAQRGNQGLQPGPECLGGPHQLSRPDPAGRLETAQKVLTASGAAETAQLETAEPRLDRPGRAPDSLVMSRLMPPPQGRSRSVRSSDTRACAGVRLVSSRGGALRHTREGDEKDVRDRAGVKDVIHFARSLDERLPRAVRGDLALGADR